MNPSFNQKRRASRKVGAEVADIAAKSKRSSRARRACNRAQRRDTREREWFSAEATSRPILVVVCFALVGQRACARSDPRASALAHEGTSIEEILFQNVARRHLDFRRIQ